MRHLLPLGILATCLSLAMPGASVAQPVSRQQAPRAEFAFVDTDFHAFTQTERREIRSVGAEAIEDIAAVLPGLPDRIEIIVTADEAVIPETGDGGAALAPGRIGWTVDASRPGGVVAIARAQLRFTLFHEVHHLVRGWTIEGGTVGNRIIDAAVSEGMATAFERDASGSDPLWGEYPLDEVAGWVRELQSGPTFAEYATWMFQHPDGRRWIGYRAGTYLTDRAMAACDCSAADLVSMSTDEVIALGS